MVRAPGSRCPRRANSESLNGAFAEWCSKVSAFKVGCHAAIASTLSACRGKTTPRHAKRPLKWLFQKLPACRKWVHHHIARHSLRLHLLREVVEQ